MKKKLEFNITINASKEKVWNTMLQDETYRQRTLEFNSAGSWFEGDWSQWSEIRFMGPDPRSPEDIGGMYSMIETNRPYEFMSIKHLGEIQNGKVVEQDAPWVGAHENYTLVEHDGVTELKVDIDASGTEIDDMFNEMRPRALKKLKEMCETK